MPENVTAPTHSKRQVASSQDVQASVYGGGGFVDYGGLAADSFDAGLKRQRDEDEYQKQIRDRETKDIDEAFGELEVPDSGVAGYDTSLDDMAREWKDEYVAAKRAYDRGEMSPAEFSAKKNELFSNADNYQKTSGILQQTIADYQTAIDEGTISDSTPPRVRDVLETLKSGSDNLRVENVNGRPTLIGITNGNQPVQVPISDIASGKNVWRFNSKADVAGATKGIYDKFSSIKISAQAADGTVTQRNPTFEELADRIGSEIDTYIGNESNVRAIASDELGLASEAYDVAPDQVKAQVKNYLTQKIKDEYYPSDTITQRKFAPQRPQRPSASASAGANARNLVDSLNASVGATLKDGRVTQATVDALQGQIGGNIASIEYDKNYFTDDEVVITTKKGEEIVASLNGGQFFEQIARAQYGDVALADTRNTIDTKPANDADPLGIGIN